MSKWTIYSKEGDVRHESVTEYNEDGAVVFSAAPEYYGTWMGDCFVTMNVKSAYPIDFHIGDYVMYRGEKFVLNYDPSIIKKARRGTYGEGFTYDSIKFNALHCELTDIRFLDYVLAGNDLHWSSLPDFPFYAASIDDFCDRLQANTNRYCQENGFSQDDYWVFLTPSTDSNGNPVRSIQRLTTSGFTEAKVRELWTQAYGAGVNVDDEKKDINVTISDQSVWNSMTMIKNNFGLNFIVRGRHVIIGAAGVPTNKVFKYGKSGRGEGLENECGLYEIERTADSEQQIITKLFGYGTDKNLPPRFYANIGKTCYAYMYLRNREYTEISLDIVWRNSYFTGKPDDDGKYNVKVSFNGNTYTLKAYTQTWGARDLITFDTPVELNRQIALDTPLTILSGVNVDMWPAESSYVPQNLPTNMAVNRLMLPGFPSKSLYQWVTEQEDCTDHDDTTGQATWRGYTAIFSKEQYNPYVISLNAAELGIREAVKTFDGSNDEEEIYPTIENTGADHIVDADAITDNGVSEDEPDLFSVTLPSFGDDFDLSEQISIGESPTISMKNGLCGGRTFTIDTAKQQRSGMWQCNVHREYDDLLQLWFPYNYGADQGGTAELGTPYQLTAGDKYVLTGVPMTDTYIYASSVKLLEATLKFLSKNDYTRYTYLPKVDEIFMARQHEEYVHGGTPRSLHDTLKEGDIMLFNDADLLIEGSVFIDTLTIKEDGNNGIPTYEVVLRNDKQVGSIQRLQEQINSLANGGNGSGTGSNKASAMQAESYIEAYGSDLFISKLKSDTAKGHITFLKGLTSIADVTINGLLTAFSAVINSVKSTNYSGSGLADTGWSITNDNGSGSSEAVFDYLTVRKKMTINSLEIKETHFTAGDICQSLATAEIVRTDYYYVDPDSGEMEKLGYSKYRVPWLLKGLALVLGKRAQNMKIFSHWKTVRINLTRNELLRCNRVRCYFLAKDGEREIENWWRENDLARCQTWNMTKAQRNTFIPNFNDHAGNIYWWRTVKNTSWNTGLPRYLLTDEEGNPKDPSEPNSTTTDPDNQNIYRNEAGLKYEVSNGTYNNEKGTQSYKDHQPAVIDGKTYHWIDIAFDGSREIDDNGQLIGDRTGWCDANSDIPAAGDKVVQFGNTVDPDRMNLMLWEVNGSGNMDAPDWKMYAGIYTFDLNLCWWGGTPQKTKWSYRTGIRVYAPKFEWITEYGIARQAFDRGHWNELPLERDDDTKTHEEDLSYYPEYSDDVKNASGVFVSRKNGEPRNFVRKCHYYDRVSHEGSMWLCVISETKYWIAREDFTTEGYKSYSKGDKIEEFSSLSPEEKEHCEQVSSYTFDEPSIASNDWMEVVEKGDDGSFKSRVFCRTNDTPLAPSNEKYTQEGITYNTFSNPIPPKIDGQPRWYDGAPDGTAILWSSTAWFYPNGTHTNWTTPAPETDTADLDIEFSPTYNRPKYPADMNPADRGNGTFVPGTSTTGSRANGSGQSADWYDPTADANNTHADWNDMIWRAERKIKNGQYIGSWSITRVKGEQGDTPVTAYRWYKEEAVATTAPTAPTGETANPTATDHTSDGNANPATTWSKNAPNRPATGWCLYMTTSYRFDDGSYGAWTTPIRISGTDGTPGEDAENIEWIYKTSPDTNVTIPTNSPNQKGYVPAGWTNHPTGIDATNIYEFACFRILPEGANVDDTKVWGKWMGILAGAAGDTPIIWSHWGRNGMDGDGFEYVFVRTTSNTAPTISESTDAGGGNAPYDGKTYLDDDFLPLSSAGRCSDDPLDIDPTNKYVWVAKRTKGAANSVGVRAWEKYSGTMSLWNRWAENAVRIDLDNQADLISLDAEGKVRFARTITVNAKIYDGASPATSGVTNSTTDSLVIGGCTPTTSLSNGVLTITWAFTKGMAAAAAVKTFKLTYNGQVYQSQFSLGTTDSEVVYQVLPNPSKVSFSKSSRNTLFPSSVSLKCDYTKDTGSGTVQTITNVTASKIDNSNYLYYRVKGSNGTWGSWTAYTGAITVSNTTTDTDYEFAISTASSAGSVTDGNTYEREVVPVVKDGLDGNSVTKSGPDTYRYATSNQGTDSSAVTGWSTTRPSSVTPGDWLWTETTIHWSNNTETVLYTNERNSIDGKAGQDIVVDGATVMKYSCKDSNTIDPTTINDWDDYGNVTKVQGKWLWSKATTYYKKANSSAGSHDAGSSINYNVSYIATNGTNGTDGRALTGSSEHYKVSNNDGSAGHQEGKPIADGQENASLEWTTDPNAAISSWGENAKYLWNYEKTTYSSGTTPIRTTPRVIAIWTKDGAAGKGIDHITNYYKASTKSGIGSDVESYPTTDAEWASWDDDPVAATPQNPYLWNFEVIYWVNPSNMTHTAPHIIGHYGQDAEIVTVYQEAESTPDRPTGSTIPPTGWSLTEPRVGYNATEKMDELRLVNTDTDFHTLSRKYIVINNTSAKVKMGIKLVLGGTVYSNSEGVAVYDGNTKVAEQAGRTGTKDNVSIEIDPNVKKVYEVRLTRSGGYADHTIYGCFAFTGGGMNISPMYVWQSHAVFHGTDISDAGWSIPVTYTAKNGNNPDTEKDEYVYVRTTENVTPTITESSSSSQSDDYLPNAKVSSGRIKGNNGTEAGANTNVQCTDDSQGINDTWKYEWQIHRVKTNGVWGAFGDIKVYQSLGKDGTDGSDAPYLSFEPQVVLFPANDLGQATSLASQTVKVEMFVKGQKATLTAITCTVSSGKAYTISTPNVSAGTFTLRPNDMTSGEDALTDSPLVVVTGTVDSKSYSVTGCLTVGVKKKGAKGDTGQTGAQGKMGRNYYYDGAWEYGKNYKLTDYEAPFVSSGTSYYVRIGESGDLSDRYSRPENNASEWALMTSTFKYIISEAIFSSYAKLGSWIFNADYMLSSKNSSGTAWASGDKFYGLDNNGYATSSTGAQSTFKPSASIDAATGRASFSGDKVHFNPDGSGWLAGGNISWVSNGSATFTGSITATGGNITGELVVGGDSQTNKIKINPTAPSIEGYNGTTKTFNLQASSTYTDPDGQQRSEGVLWFNETHLSESSLFLRNAKNSNDITVSIDIDQLTGTKQPEITLRNTSAQIFKIRLTSNGFTMGPYNNGSWATSANVSTGFLYKDSQGYLRVK